jgi:hypothetical protein
MVLSDCCPAYLGLIAFRGVADYVLDPCDFEEHGNPPAWYKPFVIEPGETPFERVPTEQELRSIFLNYARHRAAVEGGGGAA